MTKRIILGVGVVALIFFATGCACRVAETKKATPAAPAAVKPAVKATKEGLATKEQQAQALKGKEIPASKVAGTTREPATAEERQVFEIIHFDLDKSDIRPDARVILEKIAAYLKDNPKVKISIEGYCDERGTEEYNLALGERRSLSTRRYLVSLGISPDRLGTISYGKDKPTDQGHDEAAWAMNRRCEFKIID